MRWWPFRSTGDPEQLERTLLSFTNARTWDWDKLQRTVDQHPELLQEAAETRLKQMETAQHDVEAVRVLRQQRNCCAVAERSTSPAPWQKSALAAEAFLAELRATKQVLPALREVLAGAAPLGSPHLLGYLATWESACTPGLGAPDRTQIRKKQFRPIDRLCKRSRQARPACKWRCRPPCRPALVGGGSKCADVCNRLVSASVLRRNRRNRHSTGACSRRTAGVRRIWPSASKETPVRRSRLHPRTEAARRLCSCD